ncbi:cytochrome c oxidase subunit II [Fibrivirga algicola]|uniref:Cytochrome c oxidase subunit 2 n=1 Tax=Fibrivirga algicola TaxID=2950420 RepID=A0ABX0QDB5_9BACT|nr:cytochrome c oxidase subunit II [Fibrivirga algicola]NID10406.1 cytochrome c oxidase subunit II [Fibrivirga algicola]
MVYIVGLLSLVFLALAIMVFGRLTNVMKSVGSADGEETYGGTSNRINGAMFMVFLIAGTIAATWSFIHSTQYFLPEASSIHGRRVDGLFWGSMSIVTASALLTNILLFYFAYRYQYKDGKRASYYPENHKLELLWTVVPAIVMAIMVFTGWKAWRDIMSEAPEGAQEVELVGKQFNWIARYPGVDNNKLGAFNYKLIDNNNEVGIDFSDESAFDDFTAPELHIPVGKPVLIRIRARDVLHSVFIPHMRVKMDAVPGMPTRFWFHPDKTTEQMRNETGDQNFKYEIACTEICGRGHFSMKMNLVVEDQDSWKKWCAEQKPLLSSFPEYASRIPANLKAKAAKYLPTEGAGTDSTATASAGGVAGSGSASLR